MTFEAALKADNPIYEISIRLRGSYESMTRPERMFWEASYFLGDTLNGGLIQTLENSTGDNAGSVETFVNEYCNDSLRAIFQELNQMFPGAQIPATREERQATIAKLQKSDDPFEDLTKRFYALEEAFNEGLLALAKKHRESFRGLR